MERDFFMKTKRIGFSEWEAEDIELAKLLWGDSEVTRFICASGIFRQEEIENRLKSEIERNSIYHVQYWPIFELASKELIGCCGLRPYKERHMKLASIYVQSSGGRGLQRKRRRQ